MTIVGTMPLGRMPARRMSKSGRAGHGLAVTGLAVMSIVAACQFVPAAALAQAPGAGFGSNYNANASKPVDIEADVLEVDDRKKTAIFKGNVSATQGDVNLKSNEILVSYAAGAKPSGGAAAPGGKTASAASNDAQPASPFGGTGGEITRIDAKGDVVVTMKPSKEGEKIQQAKSDLATFDVKKQTVTMTGNVVLSQGENVMKGSKLTVDLTTAISRFENPGGAGTQGGRISTIFTPPPRDKDGKVEKKPAQ